MTPDELAKIGKAACEAQDGNFFVGAFAAEMIGESYPVNKKMWNIIFKEFSDKELGRKLVVWMKSK